MGLGGGSARRMSCDGSEGGGSGGCHVMDLGWWIRGHVMDLGWWVRRMSCDGLEVEAEDADWI